MTALLVDGDNLAMRSLHAVPEDAMEAQGINTGALVVFMNMLSRAVREHGPDRMLVAFDSRDPQAPLVRRQVFPEYKSQRRPAPPGREATFGLIMGLLEDLGVAVETLPGMEADDLIASAWAAERQAGEGVLILSGDKDLLQLVDRMTWVLRPGGGSLDRWDAARVTKHYGLPPERLADYLALVGDVSDNIPGVRSIGPKRAEGIIRRAMDKGEDFAALVARAAEAWDDQQVAQANLSYVLVDLREEPILAPGDVQAREFPLRPALTPDLRGRLDRYGLSRLTSTLEQGRLWADGDDSGDAVTRELALLEGVDPVR